MRVLLFLLAGCTQEPSPHLQWHDAPDLTLSPLAIDIELAAWRLAISDAAQAWENELAAVDCNATIVLADNGHAMRGYAEAAWPHLAYELGETSFGTSESIDAVGDLDPIELHRVLVHELGHAFGLVHIETRPSAMNSRAGDLTIDDAIDAAAVVGCD